MSGVMKTLRRGCRDVFQHGSYAALAAALAVLAFLLAVWLPNAGLIVEVFASRVSFFGKLQFLWSIVGSITTNFSLLSAGYTVAIALLFGANVAMIVYFLRRTRAALRRGDVAAGVSGIASGVLGVGCAACGSFLLSTVLASLGAAGAIALLPLHGGEFGLLAVALLAVSLSLIARKIAAPLVCAPAKE